MNINEHTGKDLKFTKTYTNLQNTVALNNKKEINSSVESSTQNRNHHAQRKQIAENLTNSFEIALGKKEIKKEYKIAKTGSEKEDKYDDIILEVSRKYNLDPNLIKAIIKKESTFNPKAISHAKAKGLMQLTSITIEEIKRVFGYQVKDPFDPRQNIEGGSMYLSFLLKRYNGKLDLALAAYNAGPGEVRRAKGIPQKKETIEYVKKVKQYYQEYTKMNKK